MIALALVLAFSQIAHWRYNGRMKYYIDYPRRAPLVVKNYWIWQIKSFLLSVLIALALHHYKPEWTSYIWF